MSTMTLDQLAETRVAAIQTLDAIREKIDENHEQVGLIDLLYLTTELSQAIATINLGAAIEVLIKELPR